MKNLFSKITLFFLGFVAIFALASCSAGGESGGEQEVEKEDKPVVLATPEVTLDGNMAVWDEVENTDKYEVSVDGILTYVDESITGYELEDGQTFKVRAIGDGVNYLNSSWSNSVTYTGSDVEDREDVLFS